MTFRSSTGARSGAMMGAKMNSSLVVGPIVFLAVLAAFLGAFPILAKKKPTESDLGALPESGDIDPVSVPEFQSTWKDAR